MSRPYVSARNAAFHNQRGRCFYCDFPMWLTDCAGFAAARGLTLRQAATLQATGEHLVAQQDGGRHRNNVVAACLHCNSSRHKHRPIGAPDPASYRTHVKLRVKRRRWHPSAMFNAIDRHQAK
jgi:hypothetical protein